MYQIYPRSFADSDGDGIGDLGGIADRLDYLEQLGVDVLWLSPIYPSPQDDNGYDISDYRDIDPVFGSLEGFDHLLAAGPRARHEARDGPRRQPHLRRAPVVRREPLRRGTTPSATGTGGATSPTTGPRRSPARRGTSTSATGQHYLHLFARKQPDLNWENPEVREAVYEMMRWWLERGVDGFRMDVINFISKPEGLPDGAPDPLAGRPRRLHLRPAHPRVPAGDAPRGLRRPRRPADRRRDARRDRRGGAAVHRPRQPRGRHGVPVRAREHRPGRVEVELAPARPARPQALARALAGGARRDAAGTPCTGTTTTSRGSSPAGATTASTGSPRRSCSAPSCTCTAGRRTSTRARSSG